MMILISYVGHSKTLGVHESAKHIFLGDLDIDPITMRLKLDLDIVKIYHHAKNETSVSHHSKVIV